LTSAGSLSFTIGATGYYLLTVSLTVSAIDATTRYPIALDFSFGDYVCPSAQYYNRTAGACTLCSNDANSLGTTTISGVCDCNTGYYWNRGISVCVACTGTCPTTPTDNGNHRNDNSTRGNTTSNNSSNANRSSNVA